MTRSSSLRVLLAAASVAVVALTASAGAQAQNFDNGNNVYWSIGMSAPGMQVGVANAPRMATYPPVYAAPRHMDYYDNNGYNGYNGYNSYYGQPAPVYYAPPVWQPRFGYGHHVGYGYRGGYGHHGGYGRREQERFEHGRGGWGGGHDGGHRR